MPYHHKRFIKSTILKGNPMYKYIGYSQKILSDTSFDQFIPADFSEKADIVIHHYVENEIKDILKNEYQVSVKGRDIFFRNQIGYFEARAGKEIFFEEYPGQDPAEAKEFVMGNTMAFLFFERDMNVIHGSAIRFGDKTLIVSGDSGAGKSTTASKLIREGGKLISDDQSIVYFEDNKAMLLPGYPAQKLCVDASERNNYDIGDLKKVDSQKNKYAISRMDEFYGEKSEVDKMFFLSLHEGGEDVVFEKIEGADKVNIMTNNLFLKPFFTDGIVLPPFAMMECIKMASKIDMYKISRRSGSNTEDEIFQNIEGTLK